MAAETADLYAMLAVSAATRSVAYAPKSNTGNRISVYVPTRIIPRVPQLLPYAYLPMSVEQ
eukprot:3361010-Rhodomonas_salina.7